MSCTEKINNSPLCVYKSQRFIRVRNPKLVCVYYAGLLLVLIYIAVYLVYIEHGYQTIDPVTGTTSVKLKGTGSANITGSGIGINGTVFDAMDLVVPSIEEDAFFVTTAMIITPNQTRGIWDGNDDLPACSKSNETIACPYNTYSGESQGILTGKCSIKTPYCEVYGWGPLEIDHSQKEVVNIGSFTAFVKVDVSFSEFDVQRSNTLNKSHNSLPIDGYNLFTVDEMIGNATNGMFTTVTSKLAKKGAIILMQSKWDCNLDQSYSKCNPTWEFYRLDNSTDSISNGFNYRAVSYNPNSIDMEPRLLRKLYGLRVVFTTTGQARKFSFAQLCITFGAGVAYLSVASILADIVLEKFLPNSDLLEKMKNRDHDDVNLVVNSSNNVQNNYEIMSNTDTSQQD